MPRSEKAPTAAGLPSLKSAAQRVNAPLHSQIRLTLRDIIARDFEDGDRFYTERDLIKQLGASLLTVRRALADLVAEGLLERKVGSGSFVRKITGLPSVGVFVPDYSSSVFIEMLDGLAAVLRPTRAQLKVYHTHRGESISDALRHVRSTPQEEAMVLLGNSSEINRQLGSNLLERGFRVVVLNNRLDGLPLSCVTVDDDTTIEAGLRHLTALGHRRIVCLVSEPLDGATVKSKLAAMQRGLRALRLNEARIEECEVQLWGDAYEESYRAMPRILGGKQRPTAIFALSDAGAFGALRYAYENDIQVPAQLSVLGINNSPGARFSQPALTTFALPTKQMTARAVQLLRRRSDEPQVVELPAELIVRGSTGPVAER